MVETNAGTKTIRIRERRDGLNSITVRLGPTSLRWNPILQFDPQETEPGEVANEVIGNLFPNLGNPDREYAADELEAVLEDFFRNPYLVETPSGVRVGLTATC